MVSLESDVAVVCTSGTFLDISHKGKVLRPDDSSEIYEQKIPFF